MDSRNEAVLLPIYGVMLPFHITTIKSVTNNQDNEHAYIRVAFNVGGVYEPATRYPTAIFLKELSFRWGRCWGACLGSWAGRGGGWIGSGSWLTSWSVWVGLSGSLQGGWLGATGRVCCLGGQLPGRPVLVS